MSARVTVTVTVKVVAGVAVAAASLWMADTASAQCAMCVTALEQNGGAMAAGFNRGILFLLGMPYLVFTAIGAMWYWKRRHRVLEPLPVSK
jgi:hypothetical protein